MFKTSKYLQTMELTKFNLIRNTCDGVMSPRNKPKFEDAHILSGQMWISILIPWQMSTCAICHHGWSMDVFWGCKPFLSPTWVARKGLHPQSTDNRYPVMAAHVDTLGQIHEQWCRFAPAWCIIFRLHRFSAERQLGDSRNFFCLRCPSGADFRRRKAG